MEEKCNIDISIVIPAFNEAKRLPCFLNEIINECKKSLYKYEIIVVDDGSLDGTDIAAINYQVIFPYLSVYRLDINMGKGYAVKYGLFRSIGKCALFMDADGSVSFKEIERNMHYLEEGYDIFIGSRAIVDEQQVLKARIHRKIMGKVFNSLVHCFLFKEIKDTQCGFKVFKREVIRPLFSRVYINGFGFDMELLYLAYKMGYQIKEGAVSWRHVGGSKINIIFDSIRMFINILQIRNWHCTPINPDNPYLGPNEYQYMFEMENDHWWFVSRNRLVFQRIKVLKKSNPMILDVGAGTGINLSRFNEMGDAFGFDASDRAISFCHKRGLTRLVRCFAEYISFKDKTFDVISCLDVLEHVDDPLRVLLELKRTLKDDGYLIFTVPAFRFLWSQHDEALSHRRRYSKKDLVIELESAGIRINSIGYLFLASFFVVMPVRALRKFISRGSSVRSDTTTLPPQFINKILKWILKFEIMASDKFALPFGTTLYAVASKK